MNLSKIESIESSIISQPLARKVLVVDDNESLLNVLVEVFRSQGFEVLFALRVMEALEILNEDIPDIIVCDVAMPDIDGFAFYEQISQHSEWQNIPFIFLTALTQPDEIRFAKELGCDDYITKPFEPEDLVAIVRGKLRKSDMRQSGNSQKMENYRRRIIHTLSHEFRTPLVAVNTGTELLKEHCSQLEDDRVIELLESIQRGGHRLQRLVEDFMTIQQIDSGLALSACKRFQRKSGLIDMIDLALERLEDVLFGVETLHVEIEDLEHNRRDYCAQVYDSQIVDAFMRIFSNAHKFASGELITVTLSLNDDEVLVVIRDRGQGLPDEFTNEALSLFAQINRDLMEQQGCGLGLPIASYYVDINGGALSIRSSEDGVGTQVQFSFPRV